MSVSFDPKFIKFSKGSSVTGSQMRTNLIAYWKLDETTSGTVQDAHTNNYDLNPLTSHTFNQTGILGKAIDFSPDPACNLYSGTTANFRPSGTAFSVSCWVRLNSLPGTQGSGFTLVTLGYTSDPFWAYRLRMADTNSIQWELCSSAPSTFYSITTAASVLATSTWYHIVGVFNGSGSPGKIWMNGSNATFGSPGNQPGTIITADNDFVIACDYYGGSENVHGLMDEIGLWDRALLDAEVAYLYNGGTGRTYNFD